MPTVWLKDRLLNGMDAVRACCGWATATAAGSATCAAALGDVARDGGSWQNAIVHYRNAVKWDPSLEHIWIQLGHAAKESGLWDEAESAYRTALQLNATNSDGHLQLAHLLKIRGHQAQALLHYRRALTLEPATFDARREIHWLLTHHNGAEWDFAQLAKSYKAAFVSPKIDKFSPSNQNTAIIDVTLVSNRTAFDLSKEMRAIRSTLETDFNCIDVAQVVWDEISEKFQCLNPTFLAEKEFNIVVVASVDVAHDKSHYSELLKLSADRRNLIAVVPAEGATPVIGSDLARLNNLTHITNLELWASEAELELIMAADVQFGRYRALRKANPVSDSSLDRYEPKQSQTPLSAGRDLFHCENIILPGDCRILDFADGAKFSGIDDGSISIRTNQRNWTNAGILLGDRPTNITIDTFSVDNSVLDINLLICTDRACEILIEGNLSAGEAVEPSKLAFPEEILGWINFRQRPASCGKMRFVIYGKASNHEAPVRLILVALRLGHDVSETLEAFLDAVARGRFPELRRRIARERIIALLRRSHASASKPLLCEPAARPVEPPADTVLDERMLFGLEEVQQAAAGKAATPA